MPTSSKPRRPRDGSSREAHESSILPSLNDLRMALCLAERGSLSAAASELGVTQPSLSVALKRFESRLGLELFVRSQRGVAPTRAGRLLVSRARNILDQWHDLTDAMRAETSEVRGRYSIGIYATLGAHALPRFLPKLLVDHPRLDIDIDHATSREIASGVVELRHDFGIVVNPPHHPELTIVDLYADEVRIWRATHVRRSQLGDPLPVIYSPTMPYIDGFLDEARQRGLADRIRHVRTRDLHVVAQLTTAGAGVGVLPATIARAEAKEALVSLRKTPIHRDRVSLIWRHDAQTSRAAEVIRSAIKAALTR